jgi:hypothetical protein
LYLAIRGSFLAGIGTDVKSMNPFGVCAIAGLAGAFSDTAFIKLRELYVIWRNCSNSRAKLIRVLGAF